MPDFELGPEIISRVRDATDVVEVVSDHVRLRRRGRTWEGLCPFHEEKTPSFSVDPEKGLYYCFGCHQGGDVFKFVMALQNLSFPDAVEHLAGRFGVRLPARSPEARRQRREAEQQRHLLEEAQHFFVEGLRSEGGVLARQELEHRGFEPESWRDFGFGWAPDDWRKLLEHLRPRHPEGSIVKAGLAVQPDSGKQPYDRFRRRLMFPIRSAEGHLIAFGGRILGDGEPKYLNSPEGPLFHKRSTLFSLDMARREITKRGEVLVVEGYFDCLSLQRVGLMHVVATLGTALTQDHARLLRRLLGPEGQVLLCYDADDIIRAGGIEAFSALLETPTPLLDFVLEELPANPADRRRAGLKLAPLVCSASDPALRANLVEELARRLDVRPRDIEARGRGPANRGNRPQQDSRTPKTSARPIPPGERDIARIIVSGPQSMRDRVVHEVSVGTIEDRRVRELLEVASGTLRDGDISHRIMTETDNEPLKALVAELSASELPPVTEETAGITLDRVLLKQRRNQAFALQEQIDQATRDNNLERLAELMQQKVLLRQKGDRKP